MGKDSLHDFGVSGDFLFISRFKFLDPKIHQKFLNLVVGELTAFNSC